MKFQVFVLLILFAKAALGGIVTHLPGYNVDKLPFQLETGYVGVETDMGKRQLFYYFVESERDPSNDPILFWISGGPGYSSLYAFIYEFGPLSFDLDYPFDNPIYMPKLLENPHSWSKFMNLLFVDAPAGTGFSYAETPDAYFTNNLDYGETLNKFIREWVKGHKNFQNNSIYISGDGFSGNPLPIALYDIVKDNEAKVEPHVNMGGYILVSPGTDFDLDFNLRYVYAYRMGLIADEVFEDANEKCNGVFLNPTTAECIEAVSVLDKVVENINQVHILEPLCKDVVLGTNSRHRSLQEEGEFTSLFKQSTDERQCRKYNHHISNIWANFEEVQDALQVNKGEWLLYNYSVDHGTYIKGLRNVSGYHEMLTQYPLNGLVISGSHDMEIPGFGTQRWIGGLGLDLVDAWRPWTVDKETAGFTKKYENEHFSLTYASVKGGGHFTQEYRPKECFHMAYNWTNGLPL